MVNGRLAHVGVTPAGHRPPAGREEGNTSSSEGEDSRYSARKSKRGNGSVSDPAVGTVPGFPRHSSASDCSSNVDLENGVLEVDSPLGKSGKDCRICQLSLESANQEAGVPIELGCSCKDDLAAVHKHCAEAWFKIRGNKTCEICGTIARNIVTAAEADIIEQASETSNIAAASSQPEPRSFWRGHRFLNILLACMVFAFVISWLLHFNVPP